MVKKVVAANSSISTLAERKQYWPEEESNEAENQYAAESYYTQYQLNFNAAHEDFISKSKVKPLGTY